MTITSIFPSPPILQAIGSFYQKGQGREKEERVTVALDPSWADWFMRFRQQMNGIPVLPFPFTPGDLFYASTSSDIALLPDAATGNALISGGVGLAPSWGKIGLTTHVTGVLPVTNGGTGTGTQFTAGSVVFAGSSGIYAQDNANLFWNDTTNMFGVGTASPAARTHLSGNISAAAWTTNGIGLRVDAATFTDTTASGAVTTVAVHAIGQPTLTSSASTTITNGCTLYIANGPSGSSPTIVTNAWALFAPNGLIGGTNAVVKAIGFRTFGSMSAGRIPISDGNNFISSVLTWPDSATVGDLLYCSSANTIGKLADVIVGSYLRSGGAGAVPGYSTLTLPNTSSQGDLFLSTAANAMTVLAKNTTATRYLSNTGSSNNPAWDQVNLANGVTGVLPVTNGGTSFSSYAVGDLLYANTTSTLAKLADVSAGQLLISGGVGVAPAWGTSVAQLISFQAGVQYVNQAVPSTPASGRFIFYSFNQNGFSVPQLIDSTGSALETTRDNVTVARNTSGATILKGAPVYVTGGTGAIPNIAKAKADSLTTMPAIGLVFEDIANNAFGRVMVLGNVENFDTSAFAAGDKLYVSPTTAGTLTNVRPFATQFPQSIAAVLVSGVGNGVVQVYSRDVAGLLNGDAAGGALAGTFPNPTLSASAFANPSASVGLTAVNGSATTAMRSDGAPALSQSIAPTWSGVHYFTKQTVFSANPSTDPAIAWNFGSGGVTANPLTGTTQIAAVCGLTFTSACTDGRGIQISLASTAAAYTLPLTQALRVGNTQLGAGSAITQSIGINAVEQANGTNNVTISNTNTPASGNWYFYIDSTLKNLIAGSMILGASDPGGSAQVRVNGDVAVKGVESVQLGNVAIATRMAKVGGSTYQNTTQTGNTAATETDAFSHTIVANTLATNGDKLTFTAAGTFTASASINKQIKVKFGSTTLFDTGALAITAAGSWSLLGTIIKTTDSSQKCTVSLFTSSGTLSAYSQYTAGGETLTGNLTLKLTLNGTLASDVVAEMYEERWYPTS